MRYLKLFENFDHEETVEVTLQNCIDNCQRTVFKSTSLNNALDICEEKIKQLNGKRLPTGDQSEEFNTFYTLVVDTILWVEDNLEMKYKTGLIKDPLNAFSIEKKYTFDLDKLKADPLKVRCNDLFGELNDILFSEVESKEASKMSKEEIQDLVNTYLDKGDYKALKNLSEDPNLSWFFQ